MKRYMSVAFFVLSIALIAVRCQENGTTGALPNFVMFIGDDHGVYHSNPYGAEEIQTPNMQAMADEGMQFMRAYVASPSCAPSRAALLTGLMPYRNGIVGNHERVRREGVEPLLPILANSGYEIAWYGKVGHGPGSDSGPGVTVIPYSKKAKKGYNQRLDIADVEGFLKDRKDKTRPLALFVGSRYPHQPWPEPETARIQPHDIVVPPKTFDTPETRLEMTRYVEAVEILDRKIGAVRALVNTYMKPENTVMLYTSDHGQNWPFGKWSLYETGIRTPIIAVWPGKIQPKSTTRAMVSWIDIIPTFIDIAGGEVSQDIDGRSFKPVLLGEMDSHHNTIFATHKGDKDKNVYPIRSVRNEQWKYIRNLYPEFYHTTHMDLVPEDSPYCIRSWKSWVEASKTNPKAAAFLRAYHSRPAEELYRVEEDPYEKRNLATEPQYKEVLEEMRAMVDMHMEEVGDDRSLSAEPRLLKDHPLP